METSVNHLDEEGLKETIRSLLNSDKVKLWLEPYSTADGSKSARPSELIKKYSETLKVSETLVEETLEQLRRHSTLKFTAKRKYQETDVATIYVRFSQGSNTSPNSSGRSQENYIETSLHTPVNEVKEIIGNLFKVAPEKLKLISLGKCLSENWTLNDYNVKNLGKILAICLSDDEEKLMAKDEKVDPEQDEKIEKTKKATEMMINDDVDDWYNLTVADQNGKSFDMPVEERKALAVAMMLHEKGKTCMKKKNFGLALVYLLEADLEFSKCTSQLLELVDNYALLCLDIIWCYFIMQQVDSLPDAERRLLITEERLVKSYGPEMERVQRVRGSCSQEVAVMMKLHLMQGVLSFYKREHHKAKKFLDKAEEELKSLQVDKEDMMTIMEIGYSEQEARLALRFCKGNVSQAIEHIMTKKQERRKIEEQEKEEKYRKKMAKVLGKTSSGQLVDASLYKNLTSMGFDKGATLQALKKHDNNFMLAIEFLQTNPNLRLPDPEAKKKKLKITDEMISQLVSLGFDADVSRATLHHFEGNLEEATAELFNLSGKIPKEWLDKVAKKVTSAAAAGGVDGNGSTDESNSAASAASGSASNMDTEEMKKFLEEEIIDGFNDEQDTDYLDLNVDDENNVLQEFKAKLASILDH
ncbi:hypothetical protein HELRODRAFT_189570 [Helobdella robusta]|uniref:UBA domain-containing protein n=1 Tax=Helobdella robusta TaxID=6412 RepID=T1FR59_HELRO|nr:hypothetical protein HELRODRAFT_189570 [Helobdella robusta]ESN92687.1 hypothetical protein HELRODRAFT_189570 [Helobdella robusta]